MIKFYIELRACHFIHLMGSLRLMYINYYMWFYEIGHFDAEEACFVSHDWQQILHRHFSNITKFRYPFNAWVSALFKFHRPDYVIICNYRSKCFDYNLFEPCFSRCFRSRQQWMIPAIIYIDLMVCSTEAPFYLMTNSYQYEFIINRPLMVSCQLSHGPMRAIYLESKYLHISNFIFNVYQYNDNSYISMISKLLSMLTQYRIDYNYCLLANEQAAI